MGKLNRGAKMATNSTYVPTEIEIRNVVIDKVELIPAEGASKARAKGRLVQHTSGGSIQWSKFFTTWDCIDSVVRAGEPNSVDAVVGVVDKVTSEEGDFGNTSDKERNRERITYDRTFIATGYFTRTKSKKNDKWYENLVITSLRPSA
jgi:hypothetical protein